MLVTAFLSMWINNSASANIMIPTAIAIVDELERQSEHTKNNDPQIDSGSTPGNRVNDIGNKSFRIVLGFSVGLEGTNPSQSIDLGLCVSIAR